MPTLTLILVAIVSIGMILAWRALIRLPDSLRFTTLVPAANWGLAAAILWTMTWLADHVLSWTSQSAADHLWYACAVISLCPAIAVLGSRRPGSRVWTWFILIPMLFALGWPVMTLWIQGSDIRGLQLETPQLVGYLLVLVMGTGNYFGTRYTLPGLLFVIGNVINVLSSSVICPGWLSDRWWVRLWATACVVQAILMAGRKDHISSPANDRFNQLWFDFFDQFGIVWGRRIQERVNFIAVKEGWPARLELHGVQWTTEPDPATEARLEHTFRWLLRRFVDPAWIDRRLGTQHVHDVTSLGADS
ncbi:MAG: hypothetical protein U0941_29690 [Planctomycetaceae bacterium]